MLSRTTMEYRMKALALVLFILFLFFISPASVESFNGVNSINFLRKNVKYGVEESRGRRKMVVEIEAILDYDNAGPNTKHDPKGKKTGGGGGSGGGKNP
ncbi:uncharacterized protein LOC116021261 [Ipomoea triloba]|uniref:uncharacterized protein LOC116021261 n=1 Tax=Ipomoea triloba TaxID=35885 RepID=UPI00125D6868|nr:uncharacterized protein LOC116021261 [Ipomoea triloba]